MVNIPKADALARAVDQARERIVLANAARGDGWESALLSLGTSDDKIASLRYSGLVNRLSDPVLEAMFMTEIFSFNGTVAYPEVAFSEGIKYQGLGDGEEARDYLDERFRLPEVATEAAIWGRLYGGCATWIVTDRDLAELEEELDPGEEILGLRNIERPFIVPIMDPDTFDAIGNPQWFMVNPPQGHIHATIHISRLVIWPGDLTPQRRRIQIGYWDFSCLQRPFDVLKRNGYVSQAAQQLLSEASIGVLGVEGIWAAASSGQLQTIATRMRQFNMAKNNARAILIDKDKEVFTRTNSTFAGVSDLTTNARQEVAAAFGIPMTRLMGTSATGISGDAAGDSSERVFQKNVKAKQKFQYEPRVAKLARALLSANGSPVGADGLTLMWPDLWAPTASENATIYSTIAQADAALIDREVITPEQAKSRFTPEGYSQELDVDADAVEGETGDPKDLLGMSEGGNTPDGASEEPTTQLNGAEVQALASIVSDVAAKKIPRDSGVQIVMISFGVSEEQAEKIVGSAGESFTTEEPLPTAAGAAPPKPGAPKPGGPPAPKPKDDRGDGYDREAHARDVVKGMVDHVRSGKLVHDEAAKLIATALGIQHEPAMAMLEAEVPRGLPPMQGHVPPEGTPTPPDVIGAQGNIGPHGDSRADHIEERGGKYVVVSQDRSKELGTYATKAEAEERLRQIEAHKDH
jgi:phage-related protein (TIGR01555 family)